MFKVQKRMCETCIYRPESPLDVAELERQVADKHGGFRGHRQCHHTNETPACCRGFWDRHKDEFQLGQVAQRLNCVEFVEIDELDALPGKDADERDTAD